MKANMLKTVGAAVVLLGGAAGASVAHAYVLNGALTNPAGRVDVWQMPCPAGTAVARADVTDGQVDGVYLGVLVLRPIAGPPERLKADFRVAPEGATSFDADGVPVPNVAKTFFVSVVKGNPSNPAGLEAYTSEMRCDDINGVEIGTVVPALVQDQ